MKTYYAEVNFKPAGNVPCTIEAVDMDRARERLEQWGRATDYLSEGSKNHLTYNGIEIIREISVHLGKYQMDKKEARETFRGKHVDY